MSLKNINMQALLALAGEEVQDDLSGHLAEAEGFAGELGAALRDLAVQERKERVQAAAKDILLLVQAADASTSALVQSIRDARRREKKLLSDLKEVQLAKVYGLETKNFLPLMCLLTGKSEHKVPEGWKPK